MNVKRNESRASPKVQIREVDLTADELVHALLSLVPERRLSLLDSCGAGARTDTTRLLIAGFDPFEVIEVRGDQAFVSSREERGPRVIKADALQLLDQRLEKYARTQSSDLPFPAGACIATLSYDLVHRIERLRCSRAHNIETREPDAVFAFYDTLVVHDYRQGKTFIVSGADERHVHETEDALYHTSLGTVQEVSADSVASSNMTREAYLAAVRVVQQHIAAGDIYQANLTQQLSSGLPTGLGAEHIFLRLRRDHPAPFAAFVRRSEDTVVSISPERFLRVEMGPDSRQVEAWPIKGTRPRGATAIEDAQLRAELQSSEKDRAENVMIVDLMRNDLGRVCRFGSVKVIELCTIEEHPTLFHLVSKVGGTVRDEVTAGDVLRAAFPCGSITGAPKLRAMEIIDEIETAPRGVSMGAIGYFAFDGSVDLSVAIRTMVVRDGVAHFNVGGGIVADSDPAQEYEETLVKARALLRALGVQDARFP